jgi:hypothetical protein
MRIVSLLLAGLFSSALCANTNPASSSNSALTVEKLAAQKAFIQTINQCNAPRRLSSLMIKALGEVDNDAAKAKNASLFEEIMLHNPNCAVLALNEMPAKQCEQFEAHFIRETFYVPRDQIKASLARAANFDKSCMAL